MYLLNATQGIAKNAGRWLICVRAMPLKFATIAALMLSCNAFGTNSGAFFVLGVRPFCTSPVALGMSAISLFSCFCHGE